LWWQRGQGHLPTPEKNSTSALGILKRVVLESGQEDPHVELITTILIPDEVARIYVSLVHDAQLQQRERARHPHREDASPRVRGARQEPTS
jgi:hypothetical protein